jgi:hypothetical protein
MARVVTDMAGELAVAFWQAVVDELGPDRDHARFDRPAATLRAVAVLTTALDELAGDPR